MAAKKENGPFHKSEDLFFDQNDTIEAIRELDEAESLLIFCGSGVTIDRTGQSWSQLVASILRDHRMESRDLTDAVIDDIKQTLEPLHAATVAAHYVAEQKLRSPTAAREFLEQLIQSNLYPEAGWRAGNLVQAILDLCIARDLKNKNTEIATTNYDVVIEQQYFVLRELATGELKPTCPGLRIKTSGSAMQVRARPIRSRRWITIHYLHGRLPPTGAAEGHLAFSETDYLNLQGAVASRLCRLFEKNDVLILGSGLTDPPLMHALMQTKQMAACRVAVMPIMSAARVKALTVRQATSVVQTASARMEEFGVRLLLPDFYCQVSQFVQELRLRTIVGSARYIGYKTRLESWWAEWSDFSEVDFTTAGIESEDSGAEEDRDSEDADQEWLWTLNMHERLREVLTNIRSELGPAKRLAARSRESLKLELWVRIPDDDKRSLRLTAASNGVMVEKDDHPREASLSVSSSYAAVNAFILGQPRIDEPSLDGQRIEGLSPREPRWLVFLSVPIMVRYRGGQFQAGVVTLASNADESVGGKIKTQVRSDHALAISRVVDSMKAVGTELLGLPKQVLVEDDAMIDDRE